MGLFTTRQLLGYTEQKVKFRALFLELFFRRTVNFHTEEVMLDKITGKTPVAAYVSPIVEGKVLRHRGGETRVLRPGYVKPKHEFNYQQAVERLPGEDPAQLNDPAYRRLRIITDNLKQEEHAIVQVEEMQAVNAVLYGKYTMEGDQFEKIEVDFGTDRRRITSYKVAVRSGQNRIVTRSTRHMISTFSVIRPVVFVNIAIMDGTVWRLLNGFKLFREKLDTRRGSNSQLETAVKDLGAVVSFKGYYGDLYHCGSENVLCGRGRYRKTLSAGGHAGAGEYGSRGDSLLWSH
ncbi:major capsid protein [Escherichia coli]